MKFSLRKKIVNRIDHYRTLWSILNGSKPIVGPPGISLGLTDRCNYKCIYCHHHSQEAIKGIDGSKTWRGDRIVNKDIDLAIVRDLIRDLTLLHTKYINLSGIGEPLLYNDIIEVFALINLYGINCALGTNGYLLTKEICKKIVKNNVYKVNIGLNAACPGTYSIIHAGRDKKSFDRVISQVAYLVEMRRGYDRPYIQLNSIINVYNYKEIPEMIKLGISLGADRVNFSYVAPDNFSFIKLVLLNESQEFKLKEIIKQIRKDPKLSKIKHNLMGLLNFEKKGGRSHRLAGLIPCYIGWIYSYVLSDGSVNGCCNCPDIVGNLYKNRFIDIWNSAMYQDFRKKASRLNEKSKALKDCRCEDCTHLYESLKYYKTMHPFSKRKSLEN